MKRKLKIFLMTTLSKKDEWLSHFNYENLQNQIPGLTENDFSLLVQGNATKEVYEVNNCMGRVSLKVDANDKTATLGILTTEQHQGIPEFVSNTILGDQQRNELEKGEYVPLHNNRVAYFNKEKNCVFSESITNFSLPGKIGDTEISLFQKCKLLNGEKLAAEHDGMSVILEKTNDKISVSYTPKGLNPEQQDFINTYQTNYISSKDGEKEKLNHTIIQTLCKRYFSNEEQKRTFDRLSKEIGTKGNLEGNLKEWFIIKNNEKQPIIKEEKKKDQKAIYEQADNQQSVQSKLKQGMKNFHHKVEKSMSKGKEFSSTLIQGM